MEAHRLSGGIAPLNFKFGTRWMWVMRLKPLVTSVPEKKQWFTLSWRLDGCWSWSGCIGEDMALMVLPRFGSAKIWTQDLPFQCTNFAAAKITTSGVTANILVIVLTAAPYWFEDNTKVSINKISGRFGLGVFYWWQEFLEDFSEHGNFPWSFVIGDFL
jgi:hypothetical protein